MWKDSFRIGYDIVDNQHQQLFLKTEELLKLQRDTSTNRKQELIDLILFLKQYAVQHFSDEEAYQKSLNDPNFQAHKEEHEAFVHTVLDHEKKLIASNFGEKEVKEFSGVLVTWLLYHVAAIDQTIGKGVKKAESAAGHSGKILSSLSSVLNKLASIDKGSIKKIENHSENFDDTIVIEVGLLGDLSGYLAFVFPVLFIKNLVYAITTLKSDTVGEMEESSMLGAVTFVAGDICKQFANEGISCIIETPFITKRSSIPASEVLICDTGLGIIEIDVDIEVKK